MFYKTKKLVKLISSPRSAGLMAFVVITLLVSWSSVKAIQTNYELQKQIAELQQSNDLQALENDNSRLKNAYFNTNEYLELTARRVFGKAAPGEKLLLVPKEVALKHTVDMPVKPGSVAKEPPPAKPWYQRNLEAWRDFLMHPGS